MGKGIFAKARWQAAKELHLDKGVLDATPSGPLWKAAKDPDGSLKRVLDAFLAELSRPDDSCDNCGKPELCVHNAAKLILYHMEQEELEFAPFDPPHDPPDVWTNEMSKSGVTVRRITYGEAIAELRKWDYGSGTAAAAVQIKQSQQHYLGKPADTVEVRTPEGLHLTYRLDPLSKYVDVEERYT